MKLTMKMTMKVTALLLAAPMRYRATAFVTRAPIPLLSSSAARAFHAGSTLHEKSNDDNQLLATFNEQVTRELTASQLYLSASLWCRRQDLVGMAAYMREESDEERGHAMSLIDFANQRNFKIELQPLEAPPRQWENVLALWESLLEAELENTRALNHLADLADDAHDHSLSALLDPFHMEQVESEDALRTMVAKIADEGQTPGLLRQLDSELAPATRPQVQA
jgi:ferritin